MITESVVEILRNYAAQDLPKCGDAQAIVDQIFWHYLESGRIDNDKISASYATLREKAKLPSQEYDEVLYVVSDLCIEHGRLAFIEGLRLGVVLMQELNIQESRA